MPSRDSGQLYYAFELERTGVTMLANEWNSTIAQLFGLVSRGTRHDTTKQARLCLDWEFAVSTPFTPVLITLHAESPIVGSKKESALQ